MDLTYFLFFLLSCCGMTQIIVDGSILQKFRNFVNWASNKLKIEWPKELISCYMCLSCQVGFLLGFIMQPAGDKLHYILQAILCGFASSCFTVLVVSSLNFLWSKDENS